MEFFYKINKDYYQLVPAEVVSVNYKDSNPINLYSVRARILVGSDAQSESNILSARLLDHNIKKIPLIGEIVLILRGPTSNSSKFKMTTENYYLTTYSIQNSGHLNQLPLVSGTNKQNVDKKYDTAFAGISSKEKSIIPNPSDSYSEKGEHKTLQPYAGDVIIEGRSGQAIRFGSTILKTNEYTLAPSWKGSDEGDPITIISNGYNKKGNIFSVENINDDDSSLYMTSTQQLFFKPASTTLKSINEKVSNYRKDNFKEKQIGLFSNRIILNSKNDTLFFSKNGFGFSTDGNTSFDVKNTFEIDSKLINLGMNANEQAMLGNKAINLLDELLTNLVELCTALATEQHFIISPVPGTPTTPPTSAPNITSISAKINLLKPRLPNLLSNLVKLNQN